uniref:Uncharacterized protein n=1 Tax=Schistocephalus solidus TaxID=70667 RepID=A0A0X3Q281_SCHSO
MQKDKSTLALIAAHIFVQLTVFWVHNAQFWTAHCEDKTQACNIHHLQRRLSDGYAEEFWSLQLRGMFAISLHTAWNQQFGQQDAVFSYKPLNHLQAVGKRLNAIPVITIAAYFSRAVFFCQLCYCSQHQRLENVCNADSNTAILGRRYLHYTRLGLSEDALTSFHHSFY